MNNKQYDFDNAPMDTREYVSESVEPHPYDFGVVNESWMDVAKVTNSIARSGYLGAAAKGAGVGAVGGAVVGMGSNMLKSDSDPTKKGILRSAVGGATKGALAGSVVGAGARFATGTGWGKELTAKANKNAVHNAGLDRVDIERINWERLNPGKTMSDADRSKIMQAYHDSAEKTATSLGHIYNKSNGEMSMNVGKGLFSGGEWRDTTMPNINL